MNTMMMSRVLAEDCGAPELRSPLVGGIRGKSRLTGFLKRIFCRRCNG